MGKVRPLSCHGNATGNCFCAQTNEPHAMHAFVTHSSCDTFYGPTNRIRYWSWLEEGAFH
jgi:hypothetical protein